MVIARTAGKTRNSLFSDLGYKIDDHLENRFYLTVDQTDRQLPGGLTQDQMAANPKQADPSAAPLDFSKQWYYARLADKISYVNDGQELDASFYWWHRELKEKGFFDPDDFEQGIQIYHSDNGGIGLNSVTHSELFGQRNILLTIGFSPGFETEQDHNFRKPLAAPKAQPSLATLSYRSMCPSTQKTSTTSRRNFHW